jgi:hypothetical protein
VVTFFVGVSLLAINDDTVLLVHSSACFASRLAPTMSACRIGSLIAKGLRWGAGMSSVYP